MPTSPDALTAVFDHQLSTLVELDYPGLAGLSTTAFRRRLLPLRDAAAGLPSRVARRPFPFVIVVPRSMVTTEDAMSRVRQGTRTGYVGMDGARPLSDYRAIDAVDVPAGPYLSIDLETGNPKDNLTCEQALPLLRRRRRSPLTVDEGVALATQHQGILRSVSCYWLMGERSGDRRVPALWVSRGAPRVGWCWAGTPHDWLGAASCFRRVAVGAAA